jgi:hypothetical protein
MKSWRQSASGASVLEISELRYKPVVISLQRTNTELTPSAIVLPLDLGCRHI